MSTPWPREHRNLLKLLYEGNVPCRTIAEELRWLYARPFNAMQVKSAATRYGFRRTGTEAYSTWTPRERRRMVAMYPHVMTTDLARVLNRSVHSIAGLAHKRGLTKTPECALRIGSYTGSLLQNAGKDLRFPKGNVPQNKGQRKPGWSPGRMGETQFKKGNRPHTWKAPWSFRTTSDGTLLLKTGKRSKPPLDGWEYVARLKWEQAHGQIPDWKTARLHYKDGDKTNCCLDNLELLTGREITDYARRVRDALPEPLLKAIHAKAALKRRITILEKRGNNHGKEPTDRPAGPLVCNA